MVQVSKVEGVAVVVATTNPIQEPVEGVAPEPSSLRDTTIENEGCRATPLHLLRQPQEPVAFCRRKFAMVDGGVVVGLGSSGFRIERQAHEDFCTHFVL